MTKEELKNKFSTLYNIMANSRKVSNMKLFGEVMHDMMDTMVDEHPEMAEKYISRLSAIEWDNYLTMEEAETICSKMRPSAHWTLDEFEEAIERVGGVTEKNPCFNKYALWTTMNMVYSDSAPTITSIIGTNNSDQIANAVYLLATDKLCDEDGVFNIRTYFDVN